MHGNIIQISNKHLTEDDHIDYDIMPEWFTNTIADYGGEERDTDGDKAGYITSMYPFKVQGDGFVLDKDKVESYFRYKKKQLDDAVQSLLKLTYEEFVGGQGEFVAYEVRGAINDTYGTYIVDDCSDTVTFDKWLRFQYRLHADEVFYVGAILDYHC